MNYSRAYHYFREARNNFRQTDNTREETEATLDMAAATFNSKDMEKAMRLYSAALDLADEHKYNKLAKASLTNLASLYVVSGKKQILMTYCNASNSLPGKIRYTDTIH